MEIFEWLVIHFIIMIWHFIGVECIDSFCEGTVHFSEVFSLLSCYLGSLFRQHHRPKEDSRMEKEHGYEKDIAEGDGWGHTAG